MLLTEEKVFYLAHMKVRNAYSFRAMQSFFFLAKSISFIESEASCDIMF